MINISVDPVELCSVFIINLCVTIIMRPDDYCPDDYCPDDRCPDDYCDCMQTPHPCCW